MGRAPAEPTLLPADTTAAPEPAIIPVVVEDAKKPDERLAEIDQRIKRRFPDRAPEVVAENDSVMRMFADVVRDPNVSIDKLEKLIGLQERVLDRTAKSAFDEAFAQMQADLPIIAELGRTDKGRYARREDIVKQVRPVLKAHGFSLSFETEWPEKGLISITGILTHRAGHSRTSKFVGPADDSGSKNRIQAQGSTTEYGRRYTTVDLLGIATGQDDDGQRSGSASVGDAPDGFDAWQQDMEVVAEGGFAAVEKAWAESKAEFKRFVMASPETKQWHAAVKLKAKRVDEARKREVAQ